MSGIAARLRSIEADISTLALDAIVNAANEPLIMGGGVDGAIRRKAGAGMESELRHIGRCPTGSSVVTRGHQVPAKFVIHTVAPIFSGGGTVEEQLLARCYRSALGIADKQNIASIAFPCIGTGIYGWPADIAATIAFREICDHLRATSSIAEIVFCCFRSEDRERYEKLISSLA